MAKRTTRNGHEGFTLRDIYECTPAEAAAAMGVSRQALNSWVGAPCKRVRRGSRTFRYYNLPKLIAWRRARDQEQGAQDTGRSVHLEEKRRIEAEIAKIELAELLGELIRVEDLRAGLSTMADILRQTAEQLERSYGADARQLYDETLDEIEGRIREMFPE